MRNKDTGIVFLNWGNNDYESVREIVLEEDADEVMEEIISSLPIDGWVSKNEAYVSYDRRIEQGQCLTYKNKRNEICKY